MAEDKKVVIDVDVESGDAIKRLEALEAAMFRTQEEAEVMKEQMAKGFEAAGKGAKAASGGVKKFGSVLKTALSMGGLLILLQKAFEMLKSVVENNQEAANAFAIAFESIQIVLTKVLNEAVMPLAKFLIKLFTEPQEAIDSFVESTKPVQEFFSSLTNFIVNKFLGTFKDIVNSIDSVRLKWNQLTGDTEEAAEIQADIAKRQEEILKHQSKAAEEAQKVVETVSNGVQAVVETVKDTVTDAVDAATKIVELRNAAELAEAQLQLQMLATQEEAEIQRQIRDDISKTIRERIEANTKLGEILNEQAENERAIAQTAVDSAQAQIDAYGENTERLKALILAKKELVDVDERITGQKSEQMTNEKALEKELFDFQQELRLLGKTEREVEMEEMLIEIERLAEIKRLSSDTEVDIEEEKRVRLAELNEKWDKEDEEAAKKHSEKLAKEQDKVDKAKVGAAKGVAGALGAISSAMQQAGLENQAFAKALAVGEIAINAAIAVAAAIKNATSSSATVWDMIANIAVAVGTVVGAIASASALLNQAEGPPAPPMNVQAPSSASAPSMAAASTSTTELAGSEQAQLAPIQAYVVETEMTGNQNNINQIESQANFGG
jgi:hypothetical protein